MTINGSSPQAQPPQATITHHQFDFTVIEVESGRLLVVRTPDGIEHIFPFSVEAAKTLGNALSAPKITVPRNYG